MGKAAFLPVFALLAAAGGCSSIPAPVSPGWLITIGLAILGALIKLVMWMSRADARLDTLGEAVNRSARAQEDIAKALQTLASHGERLDEQEKKTDDHESRIRALERDAARLLNR